MTEAEPLPSLGIVYLTTGDRPVFQRSLAAVLADPGTTEVVVVVDTGRSGAGEEAELLARVERLAGSDPRVRVRPTPADGGDGEWRLQRARDAGVEAARTEVVLALDDDVVVEPGVISGHARAHAAGPGQVVVGYMPVVSREPWPRSSATIEYYSEAYEGHCEKWEADPDSILKNLWGGHVSVRRADWLRAIERPRTVTWGHDDREQGLLFLREGLRGNFHRGLRGDHFYRRSLRAFVERAEKSPPGLMKLYEANPDLLEPLPPPARGRRDRISGPVLWLARAPLGWAIVRWTLFALIAFAGALRLERLGILAAHYLWFLARARALREIAG